VPTFAQLCNFQQLFSMHIIFVHGWSVTNTDTYGDLPRWLSEQGAQYRVQNVYLGKYISFVDTVTVDDIARAFQQALEDVLGDKIKEGFACITHSTGGPVVRLWMKLFHETNLSGCPMKHLIMLAPANHGSALAQLGKGTLSRIKGLIEDVEPGVRVLDWLELGSDESWWLNEAWLGYDCVSNGVYPFVLTGQTIDRSFYDHLNSYTGEAGSDGVVRAAAANMNYSLLRLRQKGRDLDVDLSRRAVPTAFGILPKLAHSGDELGIIRSVKSNTAARHPTARWVLRCLEVNSSADYKKVSDDLAALTVQTQKDERVEVEKKFFGTRKYYTDRYSMLVFRLVDDRGATLTDYDLYITGGPNYSPDDLPQGFFVDRQRNKRNRGKLTYYLNYDVLRKGLKNPQLEGRIGFQLISRPEEDSDSLAFYRPIDFRSDEDAISGILRPNETLMIEIVLERYVDAQVFQIESKLTPSKISPKRSRRTVR
jgi:hypothetical protein